MESATILTPPSTGLRGILLSVRLAPVLQKKMNPDQTALKGAV